MSGLDIREFVNHIIDQAKRKQESRDSQSVREIAALRFGMSITTEYRAYPYVLPYLGNASPRERMVALRCAAMIAEYADLGADSDDASPLRFGVWASHLARKINDDGSVDGMIASRLEYLHTQDVGKPSLQSDGFCSTPRVIALPKKLILFNCLKPFGTGGMATTMIP